MVWLRVFALAILIVPAVPASSQYIMPSSVETMRDVDPGVDDTGRAVYLSTEFRRKSELYRTEQPAGTIIVNTADRYLYLIQGNGTALRYGIGVGRDGFQWGGIE